MPTPPTFPTLAGQGWSVHKRPTFASVVASHVSGREVRAALYQNPIWQFELTFDGLDSTTNTYPGLGSQSLQSLMGLFMQCQGQFGSFLYIDPTDKAVAGGAVGTGDGVTTTFTLTRALGGFVEPVGWVTGVTGVAVGGSALGGGAYSLTTPNNLVLASAPALGAAITATFTYAFLCRFDGDDMDFEQFMSNLWQVQSVKFRSLRQQ
jgi:hypothetical protein